VHQNPDLLPHRWPNPRYACESNDWAVFQRELLALCAARHFSVQVLGTTGGEPIYRLQRPAREPTAPHLLVASGFHGEEPAGPWGLLHALMTLGDDALGRAHLAVLPLVNVSGFARGTRLNHCHENPNRGYLPSSDGVQASEEGAILLAHEPLLLASGRDGVLSCHEDQELDHAYLYANERGPTPSPLARALRQCNGEFFPLQPDGPVDGNTVQDGIVFNQFDSSFECWLFQRGVAQSYCTETPGQCDFDARLSANAAMVAMFIAHAGRLANQPSVATDFSS
jgi:predicted deacylase